MPPKQTQKTKGASKSGSRRTVKTTLMVNADGMDRHARYRQRNREEINRKKREKMREKRAANRLPKAIPDNATQPDNTTLTDNTTSHASLPDDIPLDGRSPWLRSPEEFSCAEALASLRSHASAEKTPDAHRDERDIDETLRATQTCVELDGWKYLLGLRILVQKWGSVWGGITFWPDAMEEMFLDACEHGRTSAMKLTYQVWDHAEEGRRLLHEIENMDGRLPDEPKALKILWMQYSNLHHLLVRGITIIEARMNAFDTGIFRLPGVPIDSDEEDDGFEPDFTEEALSGLEEGN